MKKLFLIVLMSTLFLYSQAGTTALASDRGMTETQESVLAVSQFNPSPNLVQRIQFEDCVVTAKIKYKAKDGTTREIEVQLTIKGVSCSDLVKEVLSK